MRAKNSYIVYFLTKSLFLGFGLAILFDNAGKDTYIGIILGLFIGLLFTYFYSYIIKKKESQSLKDIFKNYKWKSCFIDINQELTLSLLTVR